MSVSVMFAYGLALVFAWISLASFLGIARYSYRPLALLGLSALLMSVTVVIVAVHGGFWSSGDIPWWGVICAFLGTNSLFIFESRYKGRQSLRERGVSLRQLLLLKKAQSNLL